MTADEREVRLAALARRQRVWSRGESADAIPGLIDLCRQWVLPEFAAAEIGCFAGVSTSVLACFARTVLAVDPWTLAVDYHEIPPQMMAEAEKRFLAVCQEYPNITRVQGFSVDVARGVPNGSLDIVYIDGAHSRVAFVEDVAAWRPKLRPGGVLAGHDFHLVSRYFAEAGLPTPKAMYSESSWVTLIDE